MSGKRVQLFLSLSVSVIALYFALRFGVDFLHFSSLKSRACAQISQWEIVNIKGLYGLKAEYSFQFQEKTWRGSSVLNPPYHLNDMAALLALKDRAKESWAVWYNPRNPSSSSLEKAFPYGLLFRALISTGVLIYSFVLRRRLLRSNIFI